MEKQKLDKIINGYWGKAENNEDVVEEKNELKSLNNQNHDEIVTGNNTFVDNLNREREGAREEICNQK